MVGCEHSVCHFNKKTVPLHFLTHSFSVLISVETDAVCEAKTLVLRTECGEIGNKTKNHCLILVNHCLILKNHCVILKNQTMIYRIIAYLAAKVVQCGKKE